MSGLQTTIWKPDHSTTGHVVTNRISDLPGIQMVTAYLTQKLWYAGVRYSNGHCILKVNFSSLIVQVIALWDHLSGLVTFAICRCKYKLALSFTLCIFCTLSSVVHWHWKREYIVCPWRCFIHRVTDIERENILCVLDGVSFIELLATINLY